MVTVVIDQHRRTWLTVYRLQWELTQEVEATARSLEAFQRAQDRLIINAFFRCNSHRRRRIQGIVTSRRVQGDMQQILILTRQGEMPLRTNLLIIFHAYISVFAEAVGGNLTPDARQQLADHRVVHAHHRTAIERQVVQEVNKGLL